MKIDQTVRRLLPSALGVISEGFQRHDLVPFGLSEEEPLEHAGSQFQKRINRLEITRGLTMEEVYRTDPCTDDA